MGAPTHDSTELVILSADGEDALLAEISRLVAFIDRMPDARLIDIAYTAGLSRGASRIAVVASSCADLRQRLASATARISQGAARLRDKSGTYWFREKLVGGETGGKLAFVYPGPTSFYPDMMRDLAVAYPECRAPFDELEEALSKEQDFRPSDFIFPPAPHYTHDADIFSSGAYSQALVAAYAGCASMTRLAEAAGVKPDGLVGCGGGDLAAVMKSGAAGAESRRSDRISMIADIYRTVSKAIDHEGLPKTAMFTLLGRDENEIDGLIASFPPGKAHLAADFSPKMKSIAVAPDFEDEAMKAIAASGVRALRLGLDRPFNTPLCASMVPAVKKFASAWMRSKSVFEVYSCGIADKLPEKPRHARNDTAERWAKPVRFAATIRKMHADGYRVFLETGPRGLLTSAIDETLKGLPCAAIAMNSIHRRGRLQAQHAFAQLAALGADVSVAPLLVRRGAKKLDFDASLSMEFRTVSEKKLSRAFPRLTLLGETGIAAAYAPETGARGSRAAARAAAKAAREATRLQFESGASDPLISDAPPEECVPGVSYAFSKKFKISDAPFIADFAYGASQLSYSDPNLKGLVLFPVAVAAEIMAETASRVIPNWHLARIEDFACRRRIAFSRGELDLSVRAERVSPDDPATAAVKVQIRCDSPDARFTWPVMEANFIFSPAPPPPRPAQIDPLAHPRTVHWSGRDIYPSKLGWGRRLRGIVFAESWSESGIDYEVETPPLAGNVTFTRLPVWAVNPLLVQTVASGFRLWRCNEKFSGAFSFPFRFRRMEFLGPAPKEGSRLKCYLRLTGVTPKSHLCDITATDGNGNVAIEIDGWEEMTERVPKSYCDTILQPAVNFISESVSRDFLGDPGTDVASAAIVDVPYAMFERNEELWLNILGNVVLSAPERKELAEMKGSAARRTEWLFGRIAAKEAVRRYLRDFHQARWSYADVRIWPNENGKPQAIGAWGDNLSSKLDIAIAHTSQFVIALAASNARAGVDVESAARNLSEEFASGVFTPSELELAAGGGADAARSLIRFWCAKEAVSKALGTGIRYSPREMTVVRYLADTGDIAVRLEGAWLEVFKAFRGRDIMVSSRIARDHVLAFCFIPASMFDEN